MLSVIVAATYTLQLTTLFSQLQTLGRVLQPINDRWIRFFVFVLFAAPLQQNHAPILLLQQQISVYYYYYYSLLLLLLLLLLLIVMMIMVIIISMMMMMITKS